MGISTNQQRIYFFGGYLRLAMEKTQLLWGNIPLISAGIVGTVQSMKPKIGILAYDLAWGFTLIDFHDSNKIIC